jgi:hypothetical protein
MIGSPADATKFFAEETRCSLRSGVTTHVALICHTLLKSFVRIASFLLRYLPQDCRPNAEETPLMVRTSAVAVAEEGRDGEVRYLRRDRYHGSGDAQARHQTCGQIPSTDVLLRGWADGIRAPSVDRDARESEIWERACCAGLHRSWVDDGRRVRDNCQGRKGMGKEMRLEASFTALGLDRFRPRTSNT